MHIAYVCIMYIVHMSIVHMSMAENYAVNNMYSTVTSPTLLQQEGKKRDLKKEMRLLIGGDMYI